MGTSGHIESMLVVQQQTIKMRLLQKKQLGIKRILTGVDIVLGLKTMGVGSYLQEIH